MEDKEIQRDGFVFYASAWKNVLAFRKSNPELGDKLLQAIIDYGFYKEYDDSDPIIKGTMENIKISIDNASSRRESQIAGGLKSGAKSKVDRDKIYELVDQGLTYVKIGEVLGCSSKTVQRAVRERKSGQDIVDKCPQEFIF